jgi:hypothetical protein
MAREREREALHSLAALQPRQKTMVLSRLDRHAPGKRSFDRAGSTPTCRRSLCVTGFLRPKNKYHGNSASVRRGCRSSHDNTSALFPFSSLHFPNPLSPPLNNHDYPFQFLLEAIGLYSRYHPRLPSADTLLFAIERPDSFISAETRGSGNLPWCSCFHSFT